MVDAADVERIVQEVMARLRATSSPTVDSNNAPAPRTDSLSIGSRVVTLADVEGRLDNVRHVIVPPKCVVTPAVRDYLRERNVTLSYAAAGGVSGGKPAVTVVVGVAETNCDVTSVTKALVDNGAQAEQVARSGLASVVRELADHVAKGGRPALALTDRGAAALCIANRQRGVRAVRLGAIGELARDVNEVGANFLIIEPQRRSAAELRRAVTLFVDGWPRACPATYAGELN